MLVTTEHTWMSFEFWSGAKDTVQTLFHAEMDTVWCILENDIFPDGASDTEINDFFWFGTDIIAELLGYESWEQLIEEREAE